LFGFTRGKEWYDNRLTPTDFLAQGSLIVIGNNT
jgi:hypothetical protein